MTRRRAAAETPSTSAGGVSAERRYRALVEAQAALVWRADANGLIVDAWGWSAYTGLPDGSHAGARWLSAVHPGDRQRVSDHWRAAAAAGTLIPIEYRLRHADGTYRWAVARAIAVRDAAGAVTEWVGTLTDIEDGKRAASALDERDEIIRLAVESTGLGIWSLDLAAGRTHWSPELMSLVGFRDASDVTDDAFYALVHPEDRAEVERVLLDALAHATTEPTVSQYRLSRFDTGEERWLEEWRRLVLDETGAPCRFVGAILDITARKQAEIALKASEERQRLALRAARMIAWERDVKTGMIHRSGDAIGLVGSVSEHVSDFLARVPRADHAAIRMGWSASETLAPYEVEFRYHHPDGRQRWFASSVMTVRDGAHHPRLVGVTRDVTDKKQTEAQLRHAATHDALTGLNNRAWLQVEFRRLIRAARRRRSAVFLLLLDIDAFKDINDTLGHDAGDRLLRLAARRLTASVGASGCVARLGGDEFAIVLPGVPTLEAAQAAGEGCLAALARPFRHRGQRLSIGASVGIAGYPEHDATATDLFKDADLALYAAKTAGRGRVTVFERRMRQAVEERLSLAAAARDALAQDRIVPFYQPKVDLTTGAVTGFEALARWTHAERGVLTPGAFAAAFEDPALAPAIDEAVIRHAAADLRRWHDGRIATGRVSVNLSAASFRRPDLVERVLACLDAAGVPPSSFEVEVTESVFLDGGEAKVAAHLAAFRRHGITVALDDFGTGYASLTHLKRFPVDTIKVDQSFVRDLDADAESRAIVSALIGMGRNLGLKLVAEGVETAAQAERLRDWGCDQGQGYLYARPLAASRVPHAVLTLAASDAGRRAQRRRA